MQRRDFLFTSVGGIVVAGASDRSGWAEEKAKPKIIDSHTHFYDPTRPEGVPWPGKNDKPVSSKF